MEKVKFGIRQKIYLAFGGVILLFVINAIIVIFTADKSAKTVKQVASTTDPTVDLISDFKDLLIRSRMFSTNWVYLQTNKQDKEELARIHQVEYPRLLKKCNEFINNNKGKPLYQKLDTCINQFDKIIKSQSELMSILVTFEDYNDAEKSFTAQFVLEDEIIPQTDLLRQRLETVIALAKAEKKVSETMLIDLSDNTQKAILGIGIFVVVLGVMITLYIAANIANPVNEVNSILFSLSQGVLPELEDKKEGNDEIGRMQVAMHQLVAALKRTVGFARKIGSGELDAEFTKLSDNDQLGGALLDMRQSLKDAEKKERDRSAVVQSIAEIGNILRTNTELHVMGDQLIQYLCKRIGAVQGAFYLVEQDEENEKQVIKLVNSFAYSRKKYLKAEYRMGEGLVGQSAIEMDMVYRTEIPSNYVTITSGLIGDKRPSALLIMPLITNEKIYGLIELASIHAMTPEQINIIRETSEIIAQTIFNIQVNERTRKLLESAQKMGAELKEQQVVLEQNAEEMQATQEELTRSNTRLNEQIEEVNFTQKRLHSLLLNSAEVIYTVDPEGVIKYVSPSVTSILGYKEQELLGTREQDRISTEAVAQFETALADLKQDKHDTLTLQYPYRKKNGEEVWLEVTAKNLLDDPAVAGIVLNCRDITVRMLAEKEARMRSQMQSLSENSPDLICRISAASQVYYMNPVITRLTGLNTTDCIGKKLSEIKAPESVLQAWQEIMEETLDKGVKMNTEMVFPLMSGEEMIMLVNAIPEMNENGLVESVLLVSSDITERKRNELEIQNKNKKITESINYAKRIQKAILPDNEVIKGVFPQSFILYKPRDVVSGDFPWFAETEEYTFIAAVDCTGHGVPGAMLSLIGYFLLNDIVRSREVTEPGVILDLLDDGVTKTLRQDLNSDTRDGMDISLLRISKKTREIAYAGAHRPLYYVHKGELNEIKGNKFPIGGGIFKNQTNFTNTVVNLDKGDTVYFCSDGFPDQFGGPEGRKISPARIRELIVENKAAKSMDKVYERFDTFFEEWKGAEKQMDDVLLIGIKF